MARCEDKWCHKEHAVCFFVPAGDGGSAARFRLVGGPRPYLSVKSEHLGVSHFAQDRRQLRALGLALVRLTKPKKKPIALGMAVAAWKAWG